MTEIVCRTGVGGDALELVRLDGQRFALRHPETGAIVRHITAAEARRITQRPGTLHYTNPTDLQARAPRPVSRSRRS